MSIDKNSREYKNAWLRKWRHEHPERTRNQAKRCKESMEQRHPGYYNQKSQEWKKRQENIKQRRAVDAVHNNFPKLTGFCVNCGSTENIERHHPDYDKPLDFVVYCKKCHQPLRYKPFEEILQKAGYTPKPEWCKVPQEKRIGGN